MNQVPGRSCSRRRFAGFLASTLLLPGAGVRAAQSIDLSDYVKLGGIEQWISIKGDDLANPVLLVVHGGPGDVQWPQADKYVPWQKSFTVVQWDQRGAGHTYGHSGGSNTPDVNLKRIAADGVELARHLCHRLNKKKIIVLGHSWGSMVAVTMVWNDPEPFAAYVGTGQVESWAVMVQSQFDLLLAKARTDKDEATIKELESIGTPDPKDTGQFFHFTRNFRSLWARSDQAWLEHLRSQARLLKGDKDFEDDEAGQMFSSKSVLPDQVLEDLAKTSTHIGTAFFVIQGRDDVITPTKGAVDYFNRVEAPYKQLVLIPDAGHFAFMTSGDAFLSALTEKVRPVAIARGA
ncbi:MAG TPA: alpha/beta hydrolase [Rhizomicrobium sp.]|nr:alpha/beta hydrolase [Rhizomicrobium sp.]